jgi:hypothetical protein
MSLDIRSHLPALAPDAQQDVEAVESWIHAALLGFGAFIAVMLVSALSVVLHVS